MFDRTFIAPTRHVTEHVHHTEKRAPTDESVRLLREMEDAARARVVAAISVRDTHFEAVVQHMRYMAEAKDTYVAVFSLNGLKIEVTHEQPWDSDKFAWVEPLRDKIAARIASEILQSVAGRLR